MSPIILECKKICIYRCLSAVAFNILMQFVLLGVFLLFVNFHVFHPINWITETIRLLFSFYTWLSIMPLILAVFVYGILLGKSLLTAKQYYATRFRWLLGTAFRKLVFFVAHIAIGVLTTWLYARYLHKDYRSLIYNCYTLDCLNSYYIFLMGAGISAASYHFVKENLRQDPEVEYNILQETKLVKIRSLLYSMLYNCLLKSFTPTLCYALGYCIFGSFVNNRLARYLGVELEESICSSFAVVTNLRLLFYGWVLYSQILTNMSLMQKIFSIYLAEEVEFLIDKNEIAIDNQSEVTLIEALGVTEVPIVQHLAALYLLKTATSHSRIKRQQIFALTVPGSHPSNWNQLCKQSLSLINRFTEELGDSVKNISNMKYTQINHIEKPTATEAAEKILLRRYNAMSGIRRMAYDDVPIVETHIEDLTTNFDRIYHKVKQSANTVIRTIPGLYYMFGECEGAKTAFMLSNTQIFVWLIQGLAEICAASIREDVYGVVQDTLPQITRAFLKLKSVLDKLSNANLNGKKLDRNFVALRNGVKRSIYIITSAFGDYLRDIFDNPEEIRALYSFLNYQEL